MSADNLDLNGNLCKAHAPLSRISDSLLKTLKDTFPVSFAHFSPTIEDTNTCDRLNLFRTFGFTFVSRISFTLVFLYLFQFFSSSFPSLNASFHGDTLENLNTRNPS